MNKENQEAKKSNPEEQNSDSSRSPGADRDLGSSENASKKNNADNQTPDDSSRSPGADRGL